ncbi:hypothetical protein [Aquisalimonas sp.]|uniref:hypothetical protein n=1 Tax=unclassified Aquisalimonas TaxID=2644645 RepID=UPI0025C43395|nr:hypothetical protein [Aquisalimonas sp.]
MRRLSRFFRKSFLSLEESEPARTHSGQPQTETARLLDAEFDSREALQTAIRVCAGRNPSGLA